MRSAVLLLVAACGRIGFDDHSASAIDATPCMPAGTHDEDLDGIVDSCDVCPHLSDAAQPDRDGDRVGDGCDPEPEQPRQRIVVFDPFTSLDAWSLSNTGSAGDESVKLGGVAAQGSLRRAFVPANDTLVIGARTGITGNGQRMIAILFQETTAGQIFYCELFETDTAATLMLTYTLDGMTYVHPGFAPAPGLANGRGSLTASVDATAGTCALAWNGVAASTTGARPPEIDAQVLGLYAENVEAELDYFVQIRTDL